jgi:hypothetical protein
MLRNIFTIHKNLNKDRIKFGKSRKNCSKSLLASPLLAHPSYRTSRARMSVGADVLPPYRVKSASQRSLAAPSHPLLARLPRCTSRVRMKTGVLLPGGESRQPSTAIPNTWIERVCENIMATSRSRKVASFHRGLAMPAREDIKANRSKFRCGHARTANCRSRIVALVWRICMLDTRLL